MAMKSEKKYVRIQSTMNIVVTAGLQVQDLTDKSAPIADRLKVQAAWPKLTVLIEKGQHVYPIEIVEWETVKALENAGVLTIGEFLDDVNDAKEQETLANKRNKLLRNLEDVKKSTFKLDDLVKE